MPVNATISTPGSISGTTTTANTVAASTQSGSPAPQITRMAVEGIRGADGDMSWTGTWSSSTNYVVNQVVYYNGSSYIALVNNSNVTPGTDNTKWNIMAAAGAEGGAISSMEDTDISSSIGDNSIIMYHNSSTKWKDVQPFGSVHGNIALDGGTF